MPPPNTSAPPARVQQPKEHGFLFNLLWGWPWKLIGMLLASLFFSLIMEYIGIAFFWPEQGAAHSQQVMQIESGYLSTEFTRSLLLSQPTVTVTAWITQVYQWMVVDSGLLGWIAQQNQTMERGGNAVAAGLNAGSRWLASALQEYLLATVYVAVVTLIRVTILVLSIPLFLMVVLVAIVDGLGRRDLRRYGAAYESSFVYHHAKRFVKPAFYVPCMVYLSWPSAVYPNLLLLPAALMLGMALAVLAASFKKYL